MPLSEGNREKSIVPQAHEQVSSVAGEIAPCHHLELRLPRDATDPAKTVTIANVIGKYGLRTRSIMALAILLTDTSLEPSRRLYCRNGIDLKGGQLNFFIESLPQKTRQRVA
jgi:hypothetical protein